MLARLTLYYAIARLIPGAISFLSIAVYTRYLSPSDYGVYVLIVTYASLANVVFFQWLRLSLLRFYPAAGMEQKELLSSIFFAFLVMILLTGFIGLVILIVWDGKTERKLVAVAIPLIWVQAWFDLCLELTRVHLKPKSYGLISGLKSFLSIAVGGTAVFVLGSSSIAPVIGLMVGLLLSTALFNYKIWGEIHLRGQHLEKIKLFLSYGAPLSVTFALGFVIASSDRLMLAWLSGDSDVGVYSAGYDLVWQVITLLLTTVNLAAYPLVIKGFDQTGRVGAEAQLKVNGTVLLFIAVPATSALIILAPQVSHVFLGKSYSGGAALIIPWIAIAALLAGVRSYHYDLIFQLSRRTLYQVWIIGVAAILNVVLNFAFVPSYKLLGAAYATVVSYFVALVMSVMLSKKFISAPLLNVDTAKILICTLLMVVSIFPFLQYQGALWLFLQILVGLVAYVTSSIALNVAGIRSVLVRMNNKNG